MMTIRTLRVRLLRLRGQEGMSLIELLIALTVFALVVSGAAIGMGSTLAMVSSNRHRSVAANLAAAEMDKVRGSDFATLPLGDVTTTRNVGGINYTVLRNTGWIADPASASECDPPPNVSLSYLRVSVQVTWQFMAGVRPVQNQTILTPPIGAYDVNSGHLAVRVKDRDAGPGNGHVVKVYDGPTLVAQKTTIDGCAFFEFLEAGGYTVLIETAGHVDGQGVNPAEVQTSVLRGSITSVEFDYDDAATIEVTPIGLAGYIAPDGMGLTVANTGLEIGVEAFPGASAGAGGGVSCPPITVNPDQDAYLDEDNGSSNFGSSTTLRVRSREDDDNGENMRSLIRFPLPTIPAGCALVDAKLRLNATSSTGSTRTIQVRRVSQAWTESTVTWNNQPSTTSTGAVNGTSGAGIREWTVTGQVSSMYSGTNNGFRLEDTNEDSFSGPSQTYASSEATSTLPELVLTFQDTSIPICNPTTVTSNADARIRQDQPTNNSQSFGTRARTGEARRSVVKFPLPTPPTGCQFAGATLRMYQSGGSSGRVLQIYRATSNWTETGVTWNTQPTTTGSPAITTSGSTGFKTWDVGTMVAAQYAGTNHGFLLRDATETSSSDIDTTFHPREDTNDPELVVTWTAIPPVPPEPSGNAVLVGTPLFPYLSGYQAWAGTCEDADPESQLPDDGGARYPGAQREPATATTPGTTSTGTTTMKSVDITVLQADNSPVAGASVVAVHGSDNGCPAGELLQLGTTDVNGNRKSLLPYGQWSIEVKDKTPVTAWPSHLLSPVTANPEVVAVTVNP